MKTEEQYFIEGKTIQQYMNNMGKLKEESFHVYEQFLVPDDGFTDELKKHSLHFLVITEDWCGDAMMINPVIRKVAEAAGIDVRVTLRDEDTDLIDRHLTNGGRAIPIVLILNDEGTLVGKWGTRAPEVQRIVDDYRATLPEKDDPAFPEKQKEVFGKLQKRYAEEEQLWNFVYESFKKTVLEII
ncbi:thioredoxin family protein [Salinibacillus xinjiangensis]|uniref:Thioredoxin family protein n=1 Tax=Salinibacillus xinjiangensis TaxID=1229268 RepID=A0A6G1XAZ8_9BACI|nr:thioredoxin family protein [Salinibacillus xinjiangensis]MRG88099.1 thioredoxin family protein [Salinibacillus xinjiangensis]